ncbi:MAG: hypothetical protein K6F33_01580, partial [Bacteroidales bacterium]|nr:hypothetical protein [Bacteroidales bacterium]
YNGEIGMLITGVMYPNNDYKYNTEIVIVDSDGNYMKGSGEDGYLDFYGKNVLSAQGGATTTSTHFIPYSSLNSLQRGEDYYAIMFICDPNTRQPIDGTQAMSFSIYQAD